MKHLLTLFFLLLILSSCGSRKGIITTKNENTVEVKVNVPEVEIPTKPKTTETPQTTPTTVPVSTQAYIDSYSGIAMEEMNNYGIPASITLAQGILESGSGKGRLSVEANNHFGIKCHGWNGEKIYHDDDASQECFRKYKDPKYSFRDHSLFLKDRKRYSKLFQLEKDDYTNWAKELRSAGYATDKKYPQKLISLIERYNLSQYDKMVLGKDYEPTIELPEALEGTTHTVIKGDTLYSLSKKYNLSIEALKTLNKLDSNSLSLGQTLIVKL
jgi:flagellum-specific peptidoglycan hydrolase FlgJ